MNFMTVPLAPRVRQYPAPWPMTPIQMAIWRLVSVQAARLWGNRLPADPLAGASR